MKIICVEEHPTDPATDKAARPAVLGEAAYFGLMDSQDAASRPRNHHRPTMMTLPAALELDADIGDGRIKHLDEQGIQMQVACRTPRSPRSARLSRSRRTRWTGPHNLPARPGRKKLP